MLNDQWNCYTFLYFFERNIYELSFFNENVLSSIYAIKLKSYMIMVL